MGRRRCRTSLVDRLLDNFQRGIIAGSLLGDSSVVPLGSSTAVVPLELCTFCYKLVPSGHVEQRNIAGVK
jgi:hypothetical protein